MVSTILIRIFCAYVVADDVVSFSGVPETGSSLLGLLIALEVTLSWIIFGEGTIYLFIYFAKEGKNIWSMCFQ